MADRYPKVRVTLYVEPYIDRALGDLAAELGVSKSKLASTILDVAPWDNIREHLEDDE